MADIIEVAQREGSSVRTPKSVRDVLRVVASKLPKAMIAIDKIAVRLGIPLPDAIELIKLAEADGLLTTWSDTYCFLSPAKAKERGLVLVSTPYRGEARPNEWYWVRSPGNVANSGNHGDIHPWSISLEMLPGCAAIGGGAAKIFVGSPRARASVRPASVSAKSMTRIEHGDLLDRHEFADPRSTPDPMEEDRRRERLLEVAQWDSAQRDRRLPPRRCDRQGWAKSDRTEYSQAMRVGLLIGISHPGWTPAHEMAHVALDEISRPLTNARVGPVRFVTGVN